MTPTSPHSAADGFHDIKPLPEFHPVSPLLVWGPLAIGVVLLLWLAISRFRRKAPASAAKSAIEIVRERFAALERARASGTIPLRDFASQISLAFRRYLEARFGFPAGEQTPAEIALVLPSHLRGTLPLLTDSQLASMSQEIRSALRFFERVAFSDDSAERFHLESAPLLESMSQAREMAEYLDRALDEEAARLATPGPKPAPPEYVVKRGSR